MASVSIRSLAVRYNAHTVIPNLDLDVQHGEFVSLLGPSGCGKSTLLRTIAGLEDPSAGEIAIDNQPITDLPPARRGIAMVFQSYALYPHKSVRDNMGFALRMEGLASSDIAARVDEAARLLKIEHLLDKRPRQLSGGQRQRVAIGRSIVRSPKVFLFDEPLSNLDAALRVDMRVELGKLHRRLGATMIYVTHDQTEAMTMSDRIVVMDAGQIRQVGAPLDVYHNPADLFVAQFIGSPKINLFDIEPMADQPAARIRGAASLTLERPAPSADKVGVRPEDIVIDDRPGAQAARVELVEHIGAQTLIHTLLGDSRLPVIVAMHGSPPIRIGDTVPLNFPAAAVKLFADGRALAHGASLSAPALR